MMRVLILVIGLLGVASAILYLAGAGTFGTTVTAGEVLGTPRAASLVSETIAATGAAGRNLGVDRHHQILFGDLHVHSSFSTDAFQLTLPLSGGEGRHPVADACDFARFCSNLDFWSINDHANSLNERRWSETIEAMRQCEAVGASASEPDLISFLG